jgi:hypothetical protein
MKFTMVLISMSMIDGKFVTFHRYDQIPERNNLKEEGFILAHGFSP